MGRRESRSETKLFSVWLSANECSSLPVIPGSRLCFISHLVGLRAGDHELPDLPSGCLSFPACSPTRAPIRRTTGACAKPLASPGFHSIERVKYAAVQSLASLTLFCIELHDNHFHAVLMLDALQSMCVCMKVCQGVLSKYENIWVFKVTHFQHLIKSVQILREQLAAIKSLKHKPFFHYLYMVQHTQQSLNLIANFFLEMIKKKTVEISNRSTSALMVTYCTIGVHFVKSHSITHSRKQQSEVFSMCPVHPRSFPCSGNVYRDFQQVISQHCFNAEMSQWPQTFDLSCMRHFLFLESIGSFTSSAGMRRRRFKGPSCAAKSSFFFPQPGNTWSRLFLLVCADEFTDSRPLCDALPGFSTTADYDTSKHRWPKVAALQKKKKNNKERVLQQSLWPRLWRLRAVTGPILTRLGAKLRADWRPRWPYQNGD